MHHAPGKTLVVATVALLSLIWGTTWAAIRIGLRGVPPFTGVAIRFAVASVVLMLLAPLLGGRLEHSRREKVLWIVNGSLSFCASYGLLYWSEQWVPSGLASVLFATFPLLVAILAHFALPHEPLRVSTVTGTLIGFAGIAVIFSEDFAKLGGAHVAFASFILLLAPVVSALSNVAIKKWGAGLHPFSLTAVPMGLAGVVMGAIAFATERGREVEWNVTSIGAIAYLAIPGSALTFSLYYWLLQHLPATRVSLIAYISPVVAVTVGSLFLGEPYTLRTLTGTALVLSGVALANLKPRWLRLKPAGAAVAMCLAVGAGRAAELRPPIVLPAEQLPEAIRTLDPLYGFARVGISDDLSRAAAAFPPGADRRSLIVISVLGVPPRRLSVDGEVRALRFGRGDGALYVLLARPRKGGPGEAVVQRFDPLSTGKPAELRVPASAAEMDLTNDGGALLVACRNEIRVVAIPELTSPRLFRVLGDNRAAAAIAGGSRLAVGQRGALIVVDTSDRQGPDGLPFLEQVPIDGAVADLAAAPDGSSMLARLDDGRVLTVRFDPLRAEERSSGTTAVLWPGVREMHEESAEASPEPPAPSAPTPAPEPSLAESAGPAPGAAAQLPPAAEPPTDSARGESRAPDAPVAESVPASPAAPETPEAAASAPYSLPASSPETTQAAPGESPASSSPATSAAPPVAALTPAEPAAQPVAQPVAPPVASSGTAPAPAFVRGRITGLPADHALAVVLFGPDSMVREAMRVSPADDGTWRAGPLPSGNYRVVLDAGGQRAVVTDPPFLRVAVTGSGETAAPDLAVVRIVGP